MVKKPPKRSAFDNVPQMEPPPRPEGEGVPHLGRPGTEGINVAVEKKRPRNWEREHQYGKGYSVKGIRPDVNLWLLEMAEGLGVRVAEVAVFSLLHSMALVESGKLKIKPNPNPRGALMTLFPKGFELSGGDEVQDAVRKLSKKGRGVKGKKAGPKGALDDSWKTKTVNWTPFDQGLKGKIVETCRDNYPQGEFVTFLLARARADYEAGILRFNPQPKVAEEEL